MKSKDVEYSFFEKIDAHKAILIKLSFRDSRYEVLTFFREYEYLNNAGRKPNFYLSDLQKCIQETILLKEVSYDDFLQVLQRMNFKESSKERFEVMASFAE